MSFAYVWKITWQDYKTEKISIRGGNWGVQALNPAGHQWLGLNFIPHHCFMSNKLPFSLLEWSSLKCIYCFINLDFSAQISHSMHPGLKRFLRLAYCLPSLFTFLFALTLCIPQGSDVPKKKQGYTWKILYGQGLSIYISCWTQNNRQEIHYMRIRNIENRRISSDFSPWIATICIKYDQNLCEARQVDKIQ